MTMQKCRRKSDGRVLRYTSLGDGEYFVYAPQKRIWGWRHSEQSFQREFDALPERGEPDEGTAWNGRLKRAVKRLEASGLWPEIREMYKGLLDTTWEEFQDIRRLADALWCAQMKDDAEAAEMAEAGLAEIRARHPSLFNSDGRPRSGMTDSLSLCLPKSMYFGYGNGMTKERIQAAISEGQAIKERARTSYDVSFEYDPLKKAAWYSEEYKDCGNGHYYLALDANMAVFYEDD